MYENIKVIEKHRKIIADKLMKESCNVKDTTINKISNVDLEILFKHYDEIFFGSSFKNNFKGKMRFSFSKRMTRSAGITKCARNITSIKDEDINIEICMGIDFFFKYDQLERTKTVCGIETKNSLEALQIVFEHELCHAMEIVNYRNSSCKIKRFKDFAYKVFGHTESHHQMPTNREIAKAKHGIGIGDNVIFTFENNNLNGIISNINKRATVMVENKKGIFIDDKGNRYMKYYVPLGTIKKVE